VTKHQLDIFQIGQKGVGLSDEEINAVKCCYAGEANPGQQRIAIDVIIDKIAMADRSSYQVGSFDQSAFLAGRAYVGKQIRTVIRHITGETQ
jgi:hypothetical protein